MNIKRKKKFLIIISIILLIMTSAITMIIMNKKEKVYTDINLVDNNSIKDHFQESDYNIIDVVINYKAMGKKINYNGYNSEYITVYVGKNRDKEYKNVLKSTIVTDTKSLQETEVMNPIELYKQMILESFNISEKASFSEYDKPKITTSKIDETKTVYENLISEEVIHCITIIDESIIYEISYYIEKGELIGEICYYTPSNTETFENDESTEKGVG